LFVRLIILYVFVTGFSAMCVCRMLQGCSLSVLLAPFFWFLLHASGLLFFCASGAFFACFCCILQNCSFFCACGGLFGVCLSHASELLLL
jgi:hypothetical protein